MKLRYGGEGVELVSWERITKQGRSREGERGRGREREGSCSHSDSPMTKIGKNTPLGMGRATDRATKMYYTYTTYMYITMATEHVYGAK